ncbi:MAG: putative toxin-antitoxin system toxin component, PIN family [Nitrospirota bacterium]
MVFDTNVLISALVIGGRAADAVERVIAGRDQLICSRPLLDELLSVLADKFSGDGEQLSRVALFLAEIAELVAPSEEISLLADGPDNRVLECAVAGRADTIVTGDRAMLEQQSFQGIAIVTLRDYLAPQSPSP